MMIVIIKYNAGNITSVENAVRRLGYPCLITDDIDEILRADKVIFPGVGEAKSAMAYLKERELDELIKSLHQPVLGICLGLQLMCSHSEEGDTTCLGIFDAQVKKFPPVEIVPHMGWDNLSDLQGPLFKASAKRIRCISYTATMPNYAIKPSLHATISCRSVLPCREIISMLRSFTRKNRDA